MALEPTAQGGDGVNIPLDVQALRNTVSGHGGDGPPLNLMNIEKSFPL